MDKRLPKKVLTVLRELAKLSRNIEKKGISCQDIEFAIDKNLNLYLLQARPITT